MYLSYTVFKKKKRIKSKSIKKKAKHTPQKNNHHQHTQSVKKETLKRPIWPQCIAALKMATLVLTALSLERGRVPHAQ